jgi:hypothetical protein
MTVPFRRSTALLVFSLVMPAAADVIYSDLKNIPIPTDFTGVTVTVAGGQVNPFFGGVGVANNNLSNRIALVNNHPIESRSLDFSHRHLWQWIDIRCSSRGMSLMWRQSLYSIGSPERRTQPKLRQDEL